MIKPSTASSRQRLLRPILVSAVAASVAVVGLASAAAAPPDRAAAPHVGTRAQVPWQQVGSGWRVAAWVPRHAAEHVKETVFLISPSGVRYAITKVAKTFLDAYWSPDGRTMLLMGSRRAIKLDLHTGRHTRLPMPGGKLGPDRFDLGFTRGGRGLLEEAYRGSSSRYYRFDLQGHLQQAYPPRVTRAGRLADQSALPLSRGRLLVGADHGVVLFGRHGRVVRRLAPHLTGCTMPSIWRKGVVLARCNRGALWTIPLSGRSVRRITDHYRLGYRLAWRYSGGRLGLAVSGCGPDYLVRFTAAGRGRAIWPPTPDGARMSIPAYVGHHGDIVDMVIVGCGGGASTFFAYDAVAHTSTALLGPGVNGGSVIWETPWFTDK